MSVEQILLLIVTALAGALATIIANGVTAAFASRARLRRLQELELCVNLLASLEPDSDAAQAVESERADVVARMSTMAARRPLWRSFFSYLLSFMFVAVPFTLIYAIVRVFLPDLEVAVLIGALLGGAVIFAIETQPLFARPLVWRMRPGQTRGGASAE